MGVSYRRLKMVGLGLLRCELLVGAVGRVGAASWKQVETLAFGRNDGREKCAEADWARKVIALPFDRDSGADPQKFANVEKSGRAAWKLSSDELRAAAASLTGHFRALLRLHSGAATAFRAR